MKEILCFGDSNTYGLVPGTTERYDKTIRWTGLIDEKLQKYGYYVSEEGLCGRTTVFDDPLRQGRRGTELLPTLLETHKPIDTIILMLGTNDCKVFYDASPELIGLGVKRLIKQIRQITPETKIVLVSPIFLGDKIWEDGFDPEFDATSVETSHGLPMVYQKIAKEENVYYLEASSYAEPSKADREHMDVEGHRNFAKGVWSFLSQLLPEIRRETA